ncbi:MAG: archaellin/type IV pilin N-terminal domain-containing protein [archaeon]
MNQKGVSPLIASVLLLVIALAIAGTFYTWGTSFFRTKTAGIDTTTADTIDCAFASIDVKDCDFKFSNPADMNVSFRLVNNGTTSFTQADNNFMLVVSDLDGDWNSETDVNYGTQNLLPGTFAYVKEFPVSGSPNALNAPLKVRVISTQCPLVYDEVVSCS